MNVHPPAPADATRCLPLAGLRAICLLVATIASLGCTERYQNLAGLGVPPDFSIEFHVQGPVRNPSPTTTQAGPVDPLALTAQYVLEPNRRLRVAVGEGAGERYLPAVTTTITPAQQQALYDWVASRNLMAEPTSPGAERARASRRPDTPVYVVSLTAHAHRQRYQTTPGESPPTAELLARLVELGHVREVVPGAPAAPAPPR